MTHYLNHKWNSPTTIQDPEKLWLLISVLEKKNRKQKVMYESNMWCESKAVTSFRNVIWFPWLISKDEIILIYTYHILYISG